MQRVPILCYHRVHRDDDPSMPRVMPGQYCGHVTQSVFQWQMEQLAERGFSTTTHRQLHSWIAGKAELPTSKMVAIDFDDNRLNVFENALPIMERYGFTGTVFTISSWADGRPSEEMKAFPVMRWDGLAKIVERGWIIGAHTATHQHLAKLSNKEDGLERIEQEISACNDQIRKHLGVSPEHFAYPSGDWNEEAEKIVRRYYRTARHWRNAMDTSMNTASTDPYRLQAINISMLMDKSSFLRILDESQE